MRHSQSLKFQHIDHLQIFDLKAQKKNINYKKFFDIPLTFQEEIANRIQMERVFASQNVKQSERMFKIKKKGKVPLRKIDKLSNPKRHEDSMERTMSSDQLLGIIKKCDRLKTRLLTDKKLCKFQKDSSKCYDYLFELSNFNFQKYEND